MPTLLFPDNTVICNYAAVGRLDLLQEVVGANGCWTQAVFAEARKSARHIPAMADLFTDPWLGDPIEIEDFEQVERIRVASLGGNRAEPTQHLGEAETCHLIHTDPDYADSKWITDDVAAFGFGKQLGIVTWDTRNTLEQLVSQRTLEARDAFALMADMWTADRNPLRMPERWQDLQ